MCYFKITYFVEHEGAWQNFALLCPSAQASFAGTRKISLRAYFQLKFLLQKFSKNGSATFFLSKSGAIGINYIANNFIIFCDNVIADAELRQFVVSGMLNVQNVDSRP